MTPQEALDLLMPNTQTDDHVADLVTALKMLRHARNNEVAAAIVSALLYHMSYREIEDRTGFAKGTMHGWLRKQLEGSAQEGGNDG